MHLVGHIFAFPTLCSPPCPVKLNNGPAMTLRRMGTPGSCWLQTATAEVEPNYFICYVYSAADYFIHVGIVFSWHHPVNVKNSTLY